MNRVQVLRQSLQDRTAELESALALVATREGKVAAAQESFAKCNGDFEVFRTAKDLVEFETRQLSKARDSLATAQSNLDACSTALVNAEHEQRSAELTGETLAPFAAELHPNIDQARTLAAQALDLLGPVDAAFIRRLVACRALQEMNAPAPIVDSTVRFAPILVALLEQDANTLLPENWLQLIQQFGEVEARCNVAGLALLLAATLKLESFGSTDTRQQLAVGIHGKAFEAVSCREIRLQQLSALSPDVRYSEQLTKLEADREATQQRERQAAADLVQHEARERLAKMPSDPLTNKSPSESFLMGTAERTFKGARYQLETWHDPMTGLDSKKLAASSSTVSLVPKAQPIATETFTSDGLELQLLRFADGTKLVREVPKPGLIARTVAKVLDAVSPAPAATSAKPELNEHGWALLPKSKLLDEPTPETSTP